MSNTQSRKKEQDRLVYLQVDGVHNVAQLERVLGRRRLRFATVRRSDVWPRCNLHERQRILGRNKAGSLVGFTFAWGTLRELEGVVVSTPVKVAARRLPGCRLPKPFETYRETYRSAILGEDRSYPRFKWVPLKARCRAA